jgi:hypothetical protein
LQHLRRRQLSLAQEYPLPDADNVRYEPRTDRVYVGHAEKALAVIDARSLELLADIKLPAAPESFQLEKERPLIYLNTPRPSQVLTIDREKNAVLKSYPLTAAHENFPMALDEANHRILVGCRRKPMLVVLDSESGKEVAQVDIPGDTDDLFLDAKHKRIYVSCGEGSLAVIRQIDADHYEIEAKLPTVKVARTSLFDADTGPLYLIVPRHGQTKGPQVWVYQAKP